MKDFIQILLFVTKLVLLALCVTILPIYLISTTHYILAVLSSIVSISVVVYVAWKETENA